MKADNIDRGNHVVEDPRPIRAENPYSFYLPCQARLDALAAGDHVKAVFVPKGGEGGERMWLQVEGTDGETLSCTLANQPFDIPGLSFGDAVEIRRHHVIQIETDRPDDPPETNDNDRYFERCLVDERIVGGAPIHRIVRDQQEPDDYHGKEGFGWSGWRFEAEGYDETTPTGTYALVVPLRRDAGYVDMLDAPAGAVIEKAGGVWSLAGAVN